jgi:hypothetical protein
MKKYCESRSLVLVIFVPLSFCSNQDKKRTIVAKMLTANGWREI